MKKLVAILLVVVLVFAMASIACAADVVSPEQGNTDVPVKDDNTNSPQTGEPMSIVWVILAAIALCGVVFFCGKKFVAAK